MISKELLSEVLGFNISGVSVANINVTYLITEDFLEDSWYGINIYELSNKAREWAFDNGVSFKIFNSDVKYFELTPKTYNKDTEEWKSYPYFIGTSEPEVVFKAGQWILDNKAKR